MQRNDALAGRRAAIQLNSTTNSEINLSVKTAALRALGIIIRIPWRSAPELLVNNDSSSGTHVQLVKLHVLLTRL